VIYPNPRHLRAFVALADNRSFSAAAQAVHIGQPGLSQAIAKLEELVGVRLIERTTRSVRLTPAGEEFLVDARRVLEANERMMLRGSEWAHARRGRIELLSIPSMAHRLLPALVREFAKRHSSVNVDVHDHADPVLSQRLERGEGDLAIITQSDNAGSRVALPFLRDRFRVVIAASHPFAQQEVVEAAQLAGERLILQRRGALLRSHMDAAISALILTHVPIEVDQPATLTGMVEAGLGISLLPALLCPTPALRSVTTRPLIRPEIFRVIAFAQPAEREPMPAVQEFVRVALGFLAAKGDKLPEGCELLPVSAQRVKKFFSPRFHLPRPAEAVPRSG
jgi:LysR family carnitine catabolism transcriptional activator